MKKLLFLLLLIPTLVFAQEKARIFPNEGLQNFLGLDDTSSAITVKDGRAADIQNIVLDITGSAKKRYGDSYHSLLDTLALTDDFGAVTGLHEIYKADGSRIKISTCGTNLFAIDSAGVKTDIASGLTVTATADKDYQWSFITALDYDIGTNNVDPPIKTTGSTVSPFTTVLNTSDLSNALTKAKCIIWWKNYLILGNTVEATVNHPTRVRWSNVGTIETWSDDDYLDIAPIGGQQIEGFATLYDNLYIFLTDSIYKVSLVGGDELLLVTKVSEGIGCIAKNSIQNIQLGNSEGLIFLSRDKTINFCDGVKVTDISTNISNTLDDIVSTRLPYAVSINDQANLHYYLAVTSGSGSTNNLLLDFHYGIGEWSKHTGINANAFCVANDANAIPQVYFGNYGAFVYQMIDEDLNNDVVESGKSGTFTSRGITDSTTATGIIILYDSTATGIRAFTDATGATVEFTSATGIEAEAVVCDMTSTGLMVTGTITANTGTAYSIGAIDAYYTTKWYDMGNAPMRKNFGELYLWDSADTSSTMQIYYATDFDSGITSTDVNIGTEGELWGTAIWGTSTWVGSSTKLTIVPLSVSGRYIKYKFSKNSIDEPMELLGYATSLWDLSLK
jgi:hypothetical protein